MSGNIHDSIRPFREAMKDYLEVIRRNISSKGKAWYNHYLLKEGLKGYFDSKALLALAEAYDEIRSTPILNEYIVNRLVWSLEESLEACVEAGRDKEYEILRRVYSIVGNVPLHGDVRELISVLGEIAEFNDRLADQPEESPRSRVLLRLVQQLLSTIKSSLEVIARYVEELGETRP
jgi:hypothetical protein